MGKCVACGREDDDLRMGVCFDCADAGEAKAAKRSVLQHAALGISHLRPGHTWKARFDFRWAWQRLTSTGDYRRGGYFDGQDLRRREPVQ
jgi:hypothetical protein